MRSVLLMLFLTGMCVQTAGAADSTRVLTPEVRARKAIKQLGDEIERNARWVSRRRSFTMDGVPYGLTGVPVLYYSITSGINYGGWIEVADYLQRPYRYRVNVRWWLSTRGKRKNQLRTSIPNIGGDRVSVRFMTQDRRDIGTQFFGIGNDTEIKADQVALNPDFYTYHLEQQRTGIDVEYRVVGNLEVFGGLRFNRGLVSRANEARDNKDYFVFKDIGTDDELAGIGTGWSHFMVYGLIRDTRDEQEVPTSGDYFELAFLRPLKFMQPDHDFTRTTAIYTRYFSFRPSIIDHGKYLLIGRVVLEKLDGEFPFYEATEVGGSVHGDNIGEAAKIRGFESRRFADRAKILCTVELRRFIAARRIRRQFIQAQVIGFTDFGRVAPKIRDLEFKDYHYGGGTGIKFTWNSQLSLRTDIAFSREGWQWYLDMGHIF
jgi:outer membrane protein assembly factor BamA